MARKKNDGISADDGSDIEQFGTIFDQLGVKNPEPAQPDARAENNQTAPVDVSALLAKIDALSGTVNALASRPSYSPAPVQAAAAPSAPQWDWADPGLEPDRFAATLAAYTNYTIEQREANQRREAEAIQAQRNATNQLWNDFSSQYKDYAEKQDQIGYAYQRVQGRLAQQGYNVAEYAALHKNDLFKAVAAEYDAVFGSPNKPAPAAEEDDSNRTAGIFGGFEDGGRPAKGKEPAGDMIKDLKDIQRASGFF